MIYTVTCNPALDYIINLDHLTPGAIHRAGGQTVSCGGKGINVSRMLRTLGVQSVALGFVAGFTGKAMEEELVRLGIRSDFVRLTHGMSRINVKIRTDTETDINGTGPTVSYADFLKAAQKAQHWFANDHVLESAPVAAMEQKENRSIFVKTDYKIVQIQLDSILYLEGVKDYVRIHTDDGAIMTLMSMKAMEDALPATRFIRVHRSFIVNLDRVTTIERNRIVFGKVYIPITDSYKDHFTEVISKRLL